MIHHQIDILGSKHKMKKIEENRKKPVKLYSNNTDHFTFTSLVLYY